MAGPARVLALRSPLVRLLRSTWPAGSSSAALAELARPCTARSPCSDGASAAAVRSWPTASPRGFCGGQELSEESPSGRVFEEARYEGSGGKYSHSPGWAPRVRKGGPRIPPRLPVVPEVQQPRRGSAGPPHPTPAPMPTTQAYNESIGSCAFAEPVADLESERLFLEMEDRGVPRTAGTYNAMLNVCLRKDHVWDRGFAVFEHMQEAGVRPNELTYELMLRLCVQGYEWRRALELLEEVLESEDVAMEPQDVYFFAIRACGKAGEVLRAFQLYEDMQYSGVVPDEETVHQLIMASGYAERWDMAVKLFNELKAHDTLEVSQVSYVQIMAACSRAGQPGLALEFYQEMLDRWPTAPILRSFNAHITACAAMGHWEEALVVFERIKQAGLEPDHYSYSSIISACEKRAEGETAFQLYNEMRDQGLKPTAVIYAVLISVCEKTDDPQLGFSLFEDMQRHGHKPCRYDYNALILLMGRHQRWDRMQEMLEAMHKDGWSTDAAILNTIMRTYGEAGMWDKAFQLLDPLDRVGGAWHTCMAMLKKLGLAFIKPEVEDHYNPVLAILGRHGRGNAYSYARSIFERIRDSPQLHADVATFNGYMAACVNHPDKWQDALAAYEDMRTQGLEGDRETFTILLRACSKGREWRRAFLVYQEMQREGMAPDLDTYNLLIRACQQARHWERAFAVFEEMQDAEDVTPDVETYSALITTCAEAGHLVTMEEVFQSLLEAGLTPNSEAYSSLVMAYEDAGRHEQAFEVLEGMLGDGLQFERAYRVFQHHYPDDKAGEEAEAPELIDYVAVLMKCAKQGQCERGLHLLDKMAQRGVAAGVHGFNAVMHACARTGKWELAQDVFDVMRRQGVMPNVVTYNALISAYGEAGKWEEAVKVYAGMAPRPSELTYRALITAIGTRGTLARVLGYWEVGKRAQLRPQLATYNAVIRACCREGGLQPALEVLDEMLDAEEEPDGDTYSALVGVCEAERECERALEVYGDMCNAGWTPGSDTFLALMRLCEQGGQWERVVSLYEDMQRAGVEPSGEARSILVRACESGGQWDSAFRVLFV